MRLMPTGQIEKVRVLMVDIIHIIGPVPDRCTEQNSNTVVGHLLAKCLPHLLIVLGRQL